MKCKQDKRAPGPESLCLVDLDICFSEVHRSTSTLVKVTGMSHGTINSNPTPRANGRGIDISNKLIGVTKDGALAVPTPSTVLIGRQPVKSWLFGFAHQF